MKISDIVAQNNQKFISNSVENENGFKNILDNELFKNTELQFSKHANMRLFSRDIKINNEQMMRVEKGVSLAKDKGIKDTLVLVDDIALVVNTKSNVIITAIFKENIKVFTNIDGTVIV